MRKYFTEEEKREANRQNKARYRAKHREKILAKNAEYKRRNREKISEYNALRYRKIKSQHNAQMKIWRQFNLPLQAQYQAEYRFSKLKQTPAWLTEEHKQEIRDIYEAAHELSKVFPYKLHVDHIVPLRGDNASGLHVPWNLQLLPAAANLSKSNKLESLR